MRGSLKKYLVCTLIVLFSVSLSYCTRPENPDPDTPDTPGDPEVIHVSELTIGPEDDIVLEIGQTWQLSCTVLPENADDKTFRWSSDHPEIAKVSDKGLVTAVAVGDATISAIATDGGVSDIKLVTVYKPQPEAFTYITPTAPDKSDSHTIVSGHDPVIRFRPGETYQLQAKGTPEDADDALEFVNGSNSLAFDVTPDGLFTATSGCGMLNSNDYRNHYVIVRSKKNPKVSAKFFIQITGSDTKRIAIADSSVPFHFIHPMGIVLPLRYSQYIGKGHTRSFSVHLETQDGGYRSVNSNFSIVSSSGPVTFVKDGNRLKATVNTNASVCSPSSAVEASVTIRVNGGERIIPFLVCQDDPLYPKLGDGLHADKEGYLDGGYRGNGIFEEPPYSSDLLKVNAMIAYLGNGPYNSDPIYKNYCKGGIPGEGTKVYHGIVIPVNTGRLYRASQPNGEIFQKDYDTLPDSDSWPESWFTPGWITHKNENAHAYANTCAMVYRNRWCGTSHDVKPANFFVGYELFEPSKNDKEIKISDFSWESDFYGNFGSGNYKDDPFNASYNYSSDNAFFRSDWLWPAANDIGYIFRNSGISLSSLITVENTVNIYDQTIVEKINAFRSCGKFFSGTTPSYSYDYWISQSGNQDRTAPRVTISTVGSSGIISVKLVDKSKNTAYVLPIAYF